MTAVVDALVALPPWLVLLLVFLLPAAEAGLLVGVFIPGETAVLVGGVVAHAGALDLWMVVVAASLGAVFGDQAGFELGRRYGVGLAGRLPARVRQSGDLERTKAFLRRRGGAAVALGRWVAILRALVPGAAGAIGMGRARFTVFNISGGVLWATAVATAGYVVGASYRTLERDLGIGADALFVVTVVAASLWVARHRWRWPSTHGDGGSAAARHD